MRGIPNLKYRKDTNRQSPDIWKIWAGAVAWQPSGKDKSSKTLGGQDHEWRCEHRRVGAQDRAQRRTNNRGPARGHRCHKDNDKEGLTGRKKSRKMLYLGSQGGVEST